jgi:hypothetical protein
MPAVVARTSLEHPVARWAAARELAPLEVDCVTTLMLKIIDGKCKMSSDEKQTIAFVYDAIRTRPGERLGADAHSLIEKARLVADDSELIAAVYEQRLYAETMITRPVMKAFKAMLREQGILKA